MKVCALISGGKDSLFAIHCVVASGHEVVAVGHIAPSAGGEPDSEMYQSVATEGIKTVAAALELPLFVQVSKNKSNCSQLEYTPSDGDEVEDLLLLLDNVKSHHDITAVCCGALLSDYQRIRVESVCQRVGLVNLAPLWQVDQKTYIEDLTALGFHNILVKVASLGLNKKHIGATLESVTPHLINLEQKYGVHPAGEGGEYESFVLDCPLYRHRIEIMETETVLHSDDFDAPVYFLKLNQLELKPKSEQNDQWREARELLKYRSDGFVSAPVESGSIISVPSKLLVISGLHGEKGIVDALRRVESELNIAQLQLDDIIAVQLFLRDLTQFKAINDQYSTFFQNAKKLPTRICVEIELPANIPFLLSLTAVREENVGKRLKVASRSNWACSIVGEYSQGAVVYSGMYPSLFMSGIIGLRPFEHLLGCGGMRQIKLCTSHRDQIQKLLAPNLTRLTQYAFITSEQLTSVDQTNQNSFFIVVPCLPRGALVEIVPHFAPVADGGQSHLNRILLTAKTSRSLKIELMSIFDQHKDHIFQILIYSREMTSWKIEGYERTAAITTIFVSNILANGEEYNFATVIDIFPTEAIQ